MRAPEEIERALLQLFDAFNAASLTEDIRSKDSTSTAIMALRWALGEENAFGKMLASLEAVDEMHSRHDNN